MPGYHSRSDGSVPATPSKEDIAAAWAVVSDHRHWTMVRSVLIRIKGPFLCCTVLVPVVVVVWGIDDLQRVINAADVATAVSVLQRKIPYLIFWLSLCTLEPRDIQLPDIDQRPFRSTSKPKIPETASAWTVNTSSLTVLSPRTNALSTICLLCSYTDINATKVRNMCTHTHAAVVACVGDGANSTFRAFPRSNSTRVMDGGAFSEVVKERISRFVFAACYWLAPLFVSMKQRLVGKVSSLFGCSGRSYV